jgi:hypothetical protein
MSFDPMRQPDDAVRINDRLVPGIVKIKGLKAPRDWEERRSFGMMGSRLRLKGIKLAHFSLLVTLYDQADWDEWRGFAPIIRRPPQPDRSQLAAITSIPSLHRFIRTMAPPMSISNPLCEWYRIRRVVVEDVLQPEEEETGEWRAEIKLIQYQRPRRILSTSGGRNREAGTSRQDREIAALTSQLNQLATTGNR